MGNTLFRARVVGVWCLSIMAAVPALHGQSRAHYRDYQLEGNLASVAALAGVEVSDAKTIHTRPALIQELRWQRGYSAPSTDAVQQIVFSFYNDQLSKLVVDYDRDRTAGMTDADLIDALSTEYGLPLKSARNRTAMQPPLEMESGPLLARWGDADFSLTLHRAVYGAQFRIIVTAIRLDSLARTAAVRAARLDEIDAPRREVERQKKVTDDARVLQEKARVVNKAAFRP